MQGPREPNVGPGSAQILSIYGFVYFKTEEENATIFSGFWCYLKKRKRFSRQNATIFSGFWCDLRKKKALRSSTNRLVGVISMGPMKPVGPLMGPLKPMGPLMGPLKSMGSGFIVPLAPPLGGSDNMTLTLETKNPKFKTRLVLKQFCTHSDHGIHAQAWYSNQNNIGEHWAVSNRQHNKSYNFIMILRSRTKPKFFFRLVPLEIVLKSHFGWIFH